MRRVMVCVAVLIGVMWYASVATAAECGAPPAGGGEPPLASLELEEQSDTEYSGDDEALLLLFKVSDCTLSSESLVEAETESSGLDEGVFGKPVIKAKRNKLIVRIPVDKGAFDAGKHKATVIVSGEAVNSVAVPVSVQKTEAMLWPTLIAVMCWLVGVAAAFYVVMADGGKEIKWVRLPLVLAPAAIAAGAVWKTGYFDVAVWKLEAKTVLPLVLGAVPAAFGAAAAVLSKGNIVVDKPKD